MANSSIQGVGRYVVKGVGGTVTYTGAVTVAATSNKMNGADLDHDFKVDEHRDGLSSVFAVTADEPIHRLSIRFIPVADQATNTLATAKANCTLPDRLAKVTLAGFPRNNINGEWYYVGGGRIAYTPDGLVEASMNLAKYGVDPEVATVTLGTVGDFN